MKRVLADRAPTVRVPVGKTTRAVEASNQDTTQIASANLYTIHYGVLQHQVLEAASASRDRLEGAAIELTEGWFLEFDKFPNDCLTHITRFDMLKRLHMLGELSVDFYGSVVAKMRRWDVFFALALWENECAHYMFSAKALAHGWDPADIAPHGLSAALSAANSYMFGLLLKAQTSELH